jgi:hypothetical protein
MIGWTSVTYIGGGMPWQQLNMQIHSGVHIICFGKFFLHLGLDPLRARRATRRANRTDTFSMRMDQLRAASAARQKLRRVCRVRIDICWIFKFRRAIFFKICVQ